VKKEQLETQAVKGIEVLMESVVSQEAMEFAILIGTLNFQFIVSTIQFCIKIYKHSGKFQSLN